MRAELFDRYVHDVGKRLPRKLRADVEAELLSLLMDSLQSLMPGSDSADGSAAEAAQIEVLRKFGPPAAVAAGYAPPRRYLIGPSLLDVYLITTAAAVGSIALLYVLLFALSVWGEGSLRGVSLPSLGGMFMSFVGLALQGLAGITIVFAVVERLLPESAFDEDQEGDWDPRQLPEIPADERFSRTRTLVKVGIMGALLIVANLFPDKVGIYFVGSVNGSPIGWHMVPVLSPAFSQLYVPLLNVLWGLTIALHLGVLWQGDWKWPTRLGELALNGYEAYVLYCMATGPSPVSMLSGLVVAGLAIALVATVIEVAHKAYKLVWRRAAGHLEPRPSRLHPQE